MKDYQQEESWEEDFRSYFDKCLKPKKPSMGNLDREICVDFIKNLLLSDEAKVRKECGEEIRGMKITTMVGIGLDEDEKVFNQALESAASAITKQND